MNRVTFSRTIRDGKGTAHAPNSHRRTHKTKYRTDAIPMTETRRMDWLVGYDATD